ncbi:type II toxin-antitoxin system Phd/YefM family antitoxin [soil metagenome]
MSHMERIGVRELRQNASKYLSRVTAGETFEVTDRGRPVARLVPPEPTTLRDRLIAQGRLRPAREEADLLDIEPIPLPSGASPPSELVSEMREEELW